MSNDFKNTVARHYSIMWGVFALEASGVNIKIGCRKKMRNLHMSLRIRYLILDYSRLINGMVFQEIQGHLGHPR